MRRSVLLLLAASALALAACKKPAEAPQSGPPAAADATASATTAVSAPPPANGEPDAKPPVPGKPAAPATPATPNPAATPQLAYSYDYGVEAPAAKIRGLVAHEQAVCEAAGPAACEVTGANVAESGRDSVTAKLTFRAVPAWLKGYPDRLSIDVEAAGGRLIQSAVTSEDLSRDIVDTEAAVRAKTALRDRLQEMLQTRSGALDELLNVESKLADVQGDLDATTSELAAMQGRVATSDVTIEYDSAGVLAPQGVWSPVGKAVGAIAGIFAGTFAAMIYIAAFLAPWTAIIGLILWLNRKRLPKWGRPAAPKTSPAPLDLPKQD